MNEKRAFKAGQLAESLAAIVLILLVIYAAWSDGNERRAARLRIAELQRQNAALVRDVARWEDIAKRFERLNHDCLEITFGNHQP